MPKTIKLHTLNKLYELYLNKAIFTKTGRRLEQILYEKGIPKWLVINGKRCATSLSIREVPNTYKHAHTRRYHHTLIRMAKAK